MKKTFIYLCSALALGFTACDDTSNLGIAQKNEQETVMEAEGVKATASAEAAAKTLNLDTYTADNIPLLTNVSRDASVPAEGELSFMVEISPNENFVPVATIPLEALDEAKTTYGITPEQWDNAFRKLLGRAPFARINYIRVAGFINYNGQLNRLGGDDFYFVKNDLNVTPVDLHVSIESSYYMVGSAYDWTISKAGIFSRADEAVSVYDDPVFFRDIYVPMKDNGVSEYWWKIVPKSSFDANSWDGLWGAETDGSTATEGVLKENGGAGCLKLAGHYRFSIDMLNGTYNVALHEQRLYTPGAANQEGFANGWLNTSDYYSFYGYAHLNSSFTLCDGGADGMTAPTINGTCWSGADGKLKLGNDGGIAVPSDGLYWVNADLQKLTYQLTKITGIGMIGSFEGNNWASDFVTLQTANYLVWTGTVTFSGNEEWKFRTNGSWDTPDLGGAFDKLENKGSNLKAPGAGTYDVTLDLRTLPYKVTFTKK